MCPLYYKLLISDILSNYTYNIFFSLNDQWVEVLLFVWGIAFPMLTVSFIHTQGPELLSKYIGASEEAVRDAFER